MGAILSLLILSHIASAEISDSKLSLGLIGTIVFADPATSLASVSFTRSHETGVYRAGNEIGDLAEVIKIERDRLIIKNQLTKAIEYLPLGAYDPKRAVSKQAMEAPGARKEFHVRRSLVDETLKDLPAFLHAARAVPVFGSDGKVSGFKLDWIEARSLYESLGLQQGDILREVNGIKIDSVARAYEIFEQFRNSSMIRLGAQRNGRPLDLTYLVRER
jgi:general secretion pathway protein C